MRVYQFRHIRIKAKQDYSTTSSKRRLSVLGNRVTSPYNSSMKIGSCGVIIDEKGEVLLIKRDDTRTWALPAGGLEEGEAPDHGVVREVFEETGYSVLPVRLVGLEHWEMGGVGHLSLIFRCLIRGGSARTSEESLAVGFAKPSELPRLMDDNTKGRIERVRKHAGGPPYWLKVDRSGPLTKTLWFWLRRIYYPYKNWRRKRQGTPYVPPTPWTVGAFVILRNEAGEVLWVQRTDNGRWNLPGGRVEPAETPWDAAVREAKEETGLDVQLTNLVGVYTKPDRLDMVFQFEGQIVQGTLTTGPESADFAYFATGSEPENSLKNHLERVADAAEQHSSPILKVQPTHNKKSAYTSERLPKDV